MSTSNGSSPTRSPTTRAAVGVAVLTGVAFLAFGVVSLVDGLTETSREMVDGGGTLVDSRVAVTIRGLFLVATAAFHLVATFGVWRLRAGARDALLTVTGVMLAVTAVAVTQVVAETASTLMTVTAVAGLGNAVVLGLLLHPAHRVDIERADARRRGALI